MHAQCNVMKIEGICFKWNAKATFTILAQSFILHKICAIHLLFEDLVKVSDNLIEKAQALDALVVRLKLNVELGEVGDRGEDDAATVALLVVELLDRIWPS